jgi:deoxyribose-phosphate aldolase
MDTIPHALPSDPPGSPDQLARRIDHTLLRPDATAHDVTLACAEAAELGAFGVCVSPTRVRLARDLLARSGAPVRLVAVVGFPSGAHLPAVKAAEAAQAVRDGADEIDVVIDLGQAADGHWSAVESELVAVRTEVPGVLKAILETALLTEEGVVAGCLAAEAAGADFVKTSTGFSPAGGAGVEAVRTMAATVGGRLGIKASGGIRTREQALRLIEAGATRLGLSATRQVLGR